MADNNNSSSVGCGCFNIVPALLCGMIGYHLNSGLFCFLFVIWDFIFWPLAVIKWIICHELTLRLLHEVFPWFFN